MKKAGEDTGFLLWISKKMKLTKYSPGPPKKEFVDDDLRLKAHSKRREARTQPSLSRK